MASKDERAGTKCFAEFIPWCPDCGELLETYYKWNKGEETYVVECECGSDVTLETMIVFKVKKSEKLEQKKGQP